MLDLKQKSVRTSLEVGFAENALPDRFVGLRGRESRAIAAVAEFPFEDAQFEVVIMHADAISGNSVKEAHRVLRPAGRLYFTVPEKTKKQNGFTLPEIYRLVRYGFDIVGLERPRWWFLGIGERTLTICARKKNWKRLDNSYRPYA